MLIFGSSNSTHTEVCCSLHANTLLQGYLPFWALEIVTVWEIRPSSNFPISQFCSLLGACLDVLRASSGHFCGGSSVLPQHRRGHLWVNMQAVFQSGSKSKGGIMLQVMCLQPTPVWCSLYDCITLSDNSSSFRLIRLHVISCDAVCDRQGLVKNGVHVVLENGAKSKSCVSF